MLSVYTETNINVIKYIYREEFRIFFHSDSGNHIPGPSKYNSGEKFE